MSPSVPALSGRWSQTQRVNAAKEPEPWNVATIRMPPCGLVEALARVDYMPHSQVENYRALGLYKHSAHMRLAIRWRLGFGCTRAQWAELLTILKMSQAHIADGV